MSTHRFLQFLIVGGAFLFMLATLLFFKEDPSPLLSSKPALTTQNTNTYLGPDSDKSASARALVRVQISVYDDPNPQGVTIEEVTYDQQEIPLKPRDIYGFRGQGSFQNKPGTYKLQWKVRRDKYAWPRTVAHEEQVHLDPRDMWIQITITGDNAAIN